NLAGERLGVVGIFRVEIVLADVDDRQLPQLSQIHYFKQHALTQCAFAEEANGDLSGVQAFGGEGRAGGDTNTSRNDGVGTKIASGRIGDVHRSALSATVAGFLAQQLSKHAVW